VFLLTSAPLLYPRHLPNRDQGLKTAWWLVRNTGHMNNEKKWQAVIRRVLGAVLTAIGASVVTLGLCATLVVGHPVIGGGPMFIKGGVAAVAISLCLCLAGWFADHENEK